MLTSCALSIEFRIILVIVLMSIQVFYISIINIVLSLFTCFMPAFSKEVDTRNDYMYSRVLSLYAIVISICIVLYDPNRVAVMTSTRPTISVCCIN